MKIKYVLEHDVDENTKKFSLIIDGKEYEYNIDHSFVDVDFDPKDINKRTFTLFVKSSKNN